MDDLTRDTIINAGVPIDIYQNGYIRLGPNNQSALARLAVIAYNIIKNKLPLPPSLLLEFIVNRTTGTDKQDFMMAMDAKKGYGKSWSSSFTLEWYAILMAQKFGQEPKDYFSLDNCALLEDTAGISKLLDESEKQQGLLIDDAGTAIGSRDFATEKNKNFNKIASVCRTKRWFVIINSPVVTHVDLQTRELVDSKARVYKPFHDLGFNILKINSSDITISRNKKYYYERKFSFMNRKFDYWVAAAPDYFTAYKGFAEKYDLQRDKATDILIHDTAGKERDRKDPRSNREKTKQKRFDEHFPTIKDMYEQKKGIRAIARKTGLSDHMINQFIAKGGLE